MFIEPLQNEERRGAITRRCRITRQVEGSRSVQEVLWYELPADCQPPDVDDCDSYLIAMLMDEMMCGGMLTVRGSVSRRLLSNLVEFRAAWCKWLPALYRDLDIRVERPRTDEPPRVAGALCAYSGGVDSTFSVWRNTGGRNGYRTHDLNFCVMVHGFDIPLDDTGAFENALKTAGSTLKGLGLQLIPVRTNYRVIAKANWEHAFSAALAAALGNFKRHASTCLLGSSEPYDSLVIPWGSSPITDHLLSSGDMEVVHDGASHSRTEKVREISDWEAGANNLRVCWQGDSKDRNCGRCEKCLRTMLNFLASEKPIPKCFPQSLDITKELRHVVLPNLAVRAEWSQIVQYAKRHNVRGQWRSGAVSVIRRSALRSALVEAVLPKGSARRELAKNIKNSLRPAAAP